MGKEGWGHPMNSRKWHYFRDGRSLCGGWMFLWEDLDKEPGGGPDACAPCTRKLAKEKS